MTTTMEPTTLWSSMPGWGIYADLTPPELVNARNIQRLRKWLAVGLVAVLALCVGGAVMARRSASSSDGAVTTAEAETGLLTVQLHKYSGITRLQSSVTQAQGTIAAVMSNDVDFVVLLSRLQASLPAKMTIELQLVTINASSAVAPGAVSGSSVDAVIGTVVISGSGRTVDDLPRFVDNLRGIPGVVNILPTSNVKTKTGTTYNLSLSLTTQILSHRFDVYKVATK